MKLHQRIRRDQVKHTDDWLITYADTITLLLCLFVIMLSIQTGGLKVARGHLEPATPAAGSVGNIGWKPTAQARACIVAPDEKTVREEPSDAVAPPQAVDLALAARFVETPEYVVPGNIVPENIVVAAERWSAASGRPGMTSDAAAVLVDVRAPIAPEPPDSAPASLPGILDRLQSQGTAVIAQVGDRITTLQISSAAFFGSGYATISGAGVSILRDVAVTIKSERYAAYDISIEGHTDDAPISTAQFQSNWELSTARAAAVVRFFLEQGIPARKLTAAGYADTFPIAPNRNADGTVNPDNQARNRRVVIKLERIDKVDR
jgi:flagellar motor protein MotB